MVTCKIRTVATVTVWRKNNADISIHRFYCSAIFPFSAARSPFVFRLFDFSHSTFRSIASVVVARTTLPRFFSTSRYFPFFFSPRKNRFWFCFSLLVFHYTAPDSLPLSPCFFPPLFHSTSLSLFSRVNRSILFIRFRVFLLCPRRKNSRFFISRIPPPLFYTERIHRLLNSIPSRGLSW